MDNIFDITLLSNTNARKEQNVLVFSKIWIICTENVEIPTDIINISSYL